MVKCPFDSLNTEHMQQQVQRYAKVVNQCEKGLPANSVLPILREKVDTFKVLVPVVVALRNRRYASITGSRSS